jgi:O-antigen/teichoic acid export membrane protein
VLFAATLVALLVPLTEGQKLGWPAWTWIVLAVAVALAVTTFQVERRIERRGTVPLLPPSVLRLPSMWRGLAIVALPVLASRVLPSFSTATTNLVIADA